MKIFPINYKYKTYQNKTANQNKEPSFNAKLRLSGDICRSQNSFSLIFDHIKSGYFKSDEWGKIIETFRMNHSDNIVELTIKQTRRQTRKCKYSDGIKFVYGKNRYKYKFVNLRTGQVRKYQFDSAEMCRECHAEENKIMELLDKINNDNYFWSYITPALNS